MAMGFRMYVGGMVGTSVLRVVCVCVCVYECVCMSVCVCVCV